MQHNLIEKFIWQNGVGKLEKTSRKRKGVASPESPTISVIIPAKDESRTIKKVVNEAKKIKRGTEVIVVCNGAKDNTAELARQAGAKVVRLDIAVGHDVGRAIGARIAKGKVLLFIDADFVVPAQILRKYCNDVLNGWDIVLNAYSGYQTATRIHATSEAKRLLNKLLDRPDLEGSSMTTVPHALSRKALKVIGYRLLAIPPKAQAKAILNGLRVKRDHFFLTRRVNRRRPQLRKQLRHLVLGDHAEALSYLLDMKGSRGGLTDFLRNRDIAIDDPFPLEEVDSFGTTQRIIEGGLEEDGRYARAAPGEE